jgi:hypothetical protein
METPRELVLQEVTSHLGTAVMLEIVVMLHQAYKDGILQVEQ